MLDLYNGLNYTPENTIIIMVENLITMGACAAQNQEIGDYQTTNKCQEEWQQRARNYNSTQDPRKFKDH